MSFKVAILALTCLTIPSVSAQTANGNYQAYKSQNTLTGRVSFAMAGTADLLGEISAKQQLISSANAEFKKLEDELGKLRSEYEECYEECMDCSNCPVTPTPSWSSSSFCQTDTLPGFFNVLCASTLPIGPLCNAANATITNIRTFVCENSPQALYSKIPNFAKDILFSELFNATSSLPLSMLQFTGNITKYWNGKFGITLVPIPVQELIDSTKFAITPTLNAATAQLGIPETEYTLTSNFQAAILTSVEDYIRTFWGYIMKPIDFRNVTNTDTTVSAFINLFNQSFNTGTETNDEQKNDFVRIVDDLSSAIKEQLDQTKTETMEFLSFTVRQIRGLLTNPNNVNLGTTLNKTLPALFTTLNQTTLVYLESSSNHSLTFRENIATKVQELLQYFNTSTETFKNLIEAKAENNQIARGILTNSTLLDIPERLFYQWYQSLKSSDGTPTTISTEDFGARMIEAAYGTNTMWSLEDALFKTVDTWAVALQIPLNDAVITTFAHALIGNITANNTILWTIYEWAGTDDDNSDPSSFKQPKLNNTIYPADYEIAFNANLDELINTFSRSTGVTVGPHELNTYMAMLSNAVRTTTNTLEAEQESNLDDVLSPTMWFYLQSNVTDQINRALQTMWKATYKQVSPKLLTSYLDVYEPRYIHVDGPLYASNDALINYSIPVQPDDTHEYRLRNKTYISPWATCQINQTGYYTENNKHELTYRYCYRSSPSQGAVTSDFYNYYTSAHYSYDYSLEGTRDSEYLNRIAAVAHYLFTAIFDMSALWGTEVEPTVSLNCSDSLIAAVSHGVDAWLTAEADTLSLNTQTGNTSFPGILKTFYYDQILQVRKPPELSPVSMGDVIREMPLTIAGLLQQSPNATKTP